ncbi:hypothetical protein, partial [Bordetella bronchiseptica]|uniref:hypothetical protein n=1 Tax=Bordetella bronchiseptica TaxID=518 RepID=UPI001F38FEBE
VIGSIPFTSTRTRLEDGSGLAGETRKAREQRLVLRVSVKRWVLARQLYMFFNNLEEAQRKVFV